MNRTQIMTASLMLLCSRCALADPVFFDDFDGDDLKPWWSKSPPNFWKYTVADSLLKVTYLKEFSASIGTKFDPLSGDSEARAAMGWAESNGYDQEFSFAISGDASWLASFGFTEKMGDYVVRVSVPGGPYLKFPAPPPGIHDFAILRQAGEFHFVLDDRLLAVLPDSSGDPITKVGFHFTAVGPIDPLLIDRVQVVPPPGAMALLLGGACMAARRTRRTL